MTIKECYQLLGGDYEEVLTRLRKDSLAEKFVRRFPDDPSFNELTASLDMNDTETAFRAAHSLKGVCANLSFTRLHTSAHDITELLRAGKLEDAKALYPTVAEDYAVTIAAIRKLIEENG